MYDTEENTRGRWPRKKTLIKLNLLAAQELALPWLWVFRRIAIYIFLCAKFQKMEMYWLVVTVPKMDP